MDHCCSCHSEVSRDGSGQLGRYLKALDPSNAPIDDRSLEELLVFAKRYAGLIRFYDIPESQINDSTPPDKVSWSEFFRRDVAVITASIATVDLKQTGKGYDEKRAGLEQQPDRDRFRALFEVILKMASMIDGWYSVSIQDYPLFSDLVLAIQSNLKDEMQKVVAYEQGFTYVDSSHPLELDYSGIKNKGLWGLNDAINADISIYQGTDTEERIRQAALYVDDVFNSFYGFISQLITNSESYMHFALEQYPAHQPHMALFIAFLQLFRLAQEQMNGLTGKMLDFYYRDVLHLEAKPSVPDKVHVVFELAKDVAEYDVTQFTPVNAGKDAAGKDQVYKTNTDLVVNQAKVSELKTIFIEKTTTAQNLADGTTRNVETIQSIYARPVANSKDGFGEEFTDPAPKWPTFGKGSPVIDTRKNLCSQIDVLDEIDRKDAAQVGFAIASPQLVMQGGNRLLVCRVSIADRAEEAADNMFADAKLMLSAAEGWLLIDSDALAANKNKGNFDNFIQAALSDGVFHTEDFASADFQSCYSIDKQASSTGVSYSLTIYLPVSEGAIVPFDSKLHTGFPFNTPYPVMQILLGEDHRVAYDNFNSVENLSLELRVGSMNKYDDTRTDIKKLFVSDTVRLDGLKTLTILNDDGPVAPNKPFDPFTPYPRQGSSLYIGSDEIFNKPIDELSVNIQFVTEVTEQDNSQFFNLLQTANLERLRSYIKASVLEKKQWTLLARKDGADFTFHTLTQNILFRRIDDNQATAYSTGREPIVYIKALDNNTYKGFIRLENGLAYQATDNKTVFELMQELAQLIKVKEVSVSYHSNLFRLDGNTDQFFHVYPFGVVETYLNPPARNGDLTHLGNTASISETGFEKLDKAKGGLLVDANDALLPQFRYESPYADYYKKSELTTDVTTTSTPSLNRLNLLGRRSGRTATQLMLNAIRLSGSADGPLNQYTEKGDTQQGMLFIGLQDLKPLQSVSMLFQFAEGSAENEDDDPPPINWSYLTNNEWRPLKGENIVYDGTYGFQTTGIVKIDTPADATTNNTIITNGLIWFCASVTKDADRIPQLVDLVTQAVEATFEDNDNDPSHFDKALPANTISKLAEPVDEISKVEQPFASFNGKQKEVGKQFYTRVSERLRHKGRAITAWDYEHLVLDEFPSIYKVKCITHTDPNCLCRDKVSSVDTEKLFHLSYNEQDEFTPESLSEINRVVVLLNAFTQLRATITAFAPEGDIARALAMANRLAAMIVAQGVSADRLTTTTSGGGQSRTIDVEISDVISKTTKACCGPQVAPGHVLLIPIANLKNRNAANPLQPKTSRRTLLAIQDYLKTRTSPFVHVHAKNPVYEQIIVQFKVKFYKGTDKGFYLKKLNDEIVHFLTPWAFKENAEVSFNQKIYASSIINFIEERSYVDFITDFIMGVCCNECCPPVATPADTTVSGTVTDSEGKPLQGVTITALNEDGSFVTQEANEQGEFSLAIKAGVNTLKFSLKGYETKSLTAGEKTTFAISLYKLGEALQKAHSCHDIEHSLQNDPDIEGDIVASPCTSRSILVSVPHHIIIPYEEPERPSPCELRAANNTSIRNRSMSDSPLTLFQKTTLPIPVTGEKETGKTAGRKTQAHSTGSLHKHTGKETASPRHKRKKPK